MKMKPLLAIIATLGTVQADWKPVEGRISTKWAKNVLAIHVMQTAGG